MDRLAPACCAAHVLGRLDLSFLDLLAVEGDDAVSDAVILIENTFAVEPCGLDDRVLGHGVVHRLSGAHLDHDVVLVADAGVGVQRASQLGQPHLLDRLGVTEERLDSASRVTRK